MIRIRQELTAQLVQAATAAAPAECGGVLGGPSADTVTTATAVTNIAAHPQTRYELEPAGVLAALDAIEAAGDVHVGFYHSHPRGPARPSAVDRAAAAWPGSVYVICAPDANPHLAAFRYIDAAVGFERLAITVVE